MGTWDGRGEEYFQLRVTERKGQSDEQLTLMTTLVPRLDAILTEKALGGRGRSLLAANLDPT